MKDEKANEALKKFEVQYSWKVESSRLNMYQNMHIHEYYMTKYII